MPLYQNVRHAGRLLAIVAGFVLCALPILAVEQVTFRFAPASGTTLMQVTQSTRTTELGKGNVRTDVSTGKERIVFSKAANGYTVTSTVLSASMARNGQPATGPLETLTKDLTITFDISPDGHIKAVRGYNMLCDRIKRQFAPEVAQKVLSLMSEESMVNKDRAEWEGRIGQFVGKTVALGDSWVEVGEAPLPNGQTIPFFTVTTFSKLTVVDGRQLLHIDFAYNSNAAAVANQMKMTLAGLAKALGLPMEKLPQTKDISVTGKGERLIDPSTMLMYSETIERTLKMQLTIPGQGVVDGVMVEKRDKHAEFQQ